MELINKMISRSSLKKMSENMFENLVKAVVDIEKEVMMVDALMHADLEVALLELGSSQKNLWGINLYPYESGESFIEFDSMINLRPSWGNRSRGVDDPLIQKKIIELVHKLVDE